MRLCWVSSFCPCLRDSVLVCFSKANCGSQQLSKRTHPYLVRQKLRLLRSCGNPIARTLHNFPENGGVSPGQSNVSSLNSHKHLWTYKIVSDIRTNEDLLNNIISFRLHYFFLHPTCIVLNSICNSDNSNVLWRYHLILNVI